MLSVNERWMEILLTPIHDQITVAKTCSRYGISRQTLYVYQRRRYADGVAALVPLSRGPVTSPGQTSAGLDVEIVRLRKASPRWGARSIHAHLRRSGAPLVPAVSAIHRVLQRNSLIAPRAQHRAVPVWRRFERYALNDMWHIDGTQVVLTVGRQAWVIDILDDHARIDEMYGYTAGRPTGGAKICALLGPGTAFTATTQQCWRSTSRRSVLSGHPRIATGRTSHSIWDREPGNCEPQAARSTTARDHRCTSTSGEWSAIAAPRAWTDGRSNRR